MLHWPKQLTALAVVNVTRLDMAGKVKVAQHVAGGEEVEEEEVTGVVARSQTKWTRLCGTGMMAAILCL